MKHMPPHFSHGIIHWVNQMPLITWNNFGIESNNGQTLINLQTYTRSKHISQEFDTLHHSSMQKAIHSSTHNLAKGKYDSHEVGKPRIKDNQFPNICFGWKLSCMQIRKDVLQLYYKYLLS